MNHILIAVPDSRERRRLSQALHSHFGAACTLLEAATGREAAELFLQHHPHAAILNIRLPERSGLEAARQIRQSGFPCALIFLTDESSHDLARQVIALKAADFLLRPFPERELLDSLEKALPKPAGDGTQEELSESRLALIRENIEQYLRAHYAEELSMQDVAKAMNYSDAYFCKLFKQCFRVNFSVWLNGYRVMKAKKLLLDTRLSIRDVSLACGYADPNYFGRVFRQITGKTPSQYRISP